jgi:hypothetical protein
MSNVLWLVHSWMFGLDLADYTADEEGTNCSSLSELACVWCLN